MFILLAAAFIYFLFLKSIAAEDILGEAAVMRCYPKVAPKVIDNFFKYRKL